MNYQSLLLLCGVICGISAYAIEGSWQSNDYNKTEIAVSAVSTDLNGLNNYKIDIDGCTPSLSFKISQSYIQLTNLGKPTCTSGTATALMNSLQEKFFYFQIYYDQLLLVNIYGNKSLAFLRAKKDMRNYNLIGEFATPSGSQVIITNQSLFLCNNSLKMDYFGNSKNTFKIGNQTAVGTCQDQDSNALLTQLQQAQYYRLQNPSILRFYAANNSEVSQLNKMRNWSGISPVVNSNTGNNAVVFNNTNLGKNNDSNSNKTEATEHANNSIIAPNNNDNQKNISSGTGTKNSTQTQPSNATQPTGTQQSNESQQSNGNQSSTSSQSTSNASTSQSSTSSVNDSSEQNSSFTSTSDYSTIRLTYSMAAAVWFPEYFMVSDQSTWPSKIALNATNLAFMGCNTVTMPFAINYNTLTTIVGGTVTQSRKACGNTDQPYIDLIKKSQRVVATANQTAFKLIFYDKNNSNLFAVSRNLTAAQKKNLVMDATNPTAIPNTSYPIPYQTSTTVTVTNTTNTSHASSSSNASSSSSSTTSTIVSNGTTSTTSTAASSSSQSSSSSSSNSTSSSTSTTTVTTTPSTSLLVGRYNPSKVGLTTLPSVLTSNIFFIFTPTFIFVSGTCNNYVYPYSLNQQGETTLISIDIGNKQVQMNSGCDSSNDNLFIQPFEQSSSITLISSNGNKITMNLANNAGNPTLSLAKVVASNSS